MSTAHRPTAVRPGRVLRLALVAWGLGHLAMGRTRTGLTWLVAEVVSAALVAWLLLGLADTTAYLLPFLAGCAFLTAWAAQAIAAYRGARSAGGAIGPTPVRSPAAAIAWLSIPLLVWGTTFWLVGASASSPATVLDRFETSWPGLANGGSLPSGIAVDPVAATRAARQALVALKTACVPEDDTGGKAACDDPTALLSDLRITLTEESPESARAVAQLVTFERHRTTILGFIGASELVPVPVQIGRAHV